MDRFDRIDMLIGDRMLRHLFQGTGEPGMLRK